MRGLLIASLLAATPAYADVFEKGFLERLDEGVELKDSQRGKIKRLLDKEKKGRERDVERLEELEKKVDQLRQKLGREEHKTREKVRDMLSLEQKERFDEIIHHMRQRDRRRHEGLPWEDGPANAIGSIAIEAYDVANSLIWNSTVDLTSSKSWNDWIVIPVEMAAVSSLKFLAPRSLNRSYKFWPSIDNLMINEPPYTDISFLTQTSVNPVPVPGAAWLFGSAIGLLGWRRRSRS